MAEKFVSKYKKPLIIGAAALVVVAALIVALVLIFGGGEAQPTGNVTYTVSVTDQNGVAFANVGVYVYEDSTKAELVWFARTDADGKVTFTDAASNRYVAVLSELPAGYKTEESYLLTGENTAIVLTTGTLDEFMDAVTFKLGDTMLDFAVTAVDGKTYTLSELLEQKKAVMLNFWYLGCVPCKMEFPYLQEAYEAYSDRVEVLAIDPYGDTAEAIASYQTQNGLTFPMIAGDARWMNVMQVKAFPTTVIIDRTGTISLIHVSSITDAQTFMDIFEYYTSDAYDPTVLESYEDIYATKTGTNASA